MPEDNLIDWEQVRLKARRMLKDWAEGKQMPLYRRRESVTADEVIAKIQASPEWGVGTAESYRLAELWRNINSLVDEICGKNGIENENATRR